MAGHYPFSGKANRVSIYAFFERHGLSAPLQEKYYKWWYDWAKAFVLNDADLKVSKGIEFAAYPYGQHAHHDFHLNRYVWCTHMIDLGQFIEGVIFPKLDHAQRERLEHDHRQFLAQLRSETQTHPREAPPEIGRYRHT